MFKTDLRKAWPECVTLTYLPIKVYRPKRKANNRTVQGLLVGGL